MNVFVRQNISKLTTPTFRLSLLSCAFLTLIKPNYSHADRLRPPTHIIASSSKFSSSKSNVLSCQEDKYDGVIVDVEHLPTNVDDFTASLTHSLAVWKNDHKRGIWLKLPIEKVAFVEPAVKLGFVYHHAEKGYIMLTHWLSEQENKMPPSATHQLGVGCVVFNKKNEMMLVQERSGLLRGTGVWKMPTGKSCTLLNYK